MGKKGGSKKKKGGKKKIVEEPQEIRDAIVHARMGNVKKLTKFLMADTASKHYDWEQTAQEIYKVACESGQVECVAVCLDAGCDVNLMGGTGVQGAARFDQLSVLQLLYDKGADMNAKNLFQEWSAIHYAASKGSLKVTNFLVKHNADVNITTHDENNGTFNSWAPIHLAADNGHTNVVEYLVEVGKCNVDKETADKDTALAIAAERGRFDTVRYLVGAGANIHAARRGLSVVQWCIYRCNAECVQFLVSYGAKADLDVKCVWFPGGLTLQQICQRDFSPPVYEKIDTAIYRGGVKLRDRAAHMRLLGDLRWTNKGAYDPNAPAPEEGEEEVTILMFPKHVVHLISAYEL